MTNTNGDLPCLIQTFVARMHHQLKSQMRPYVLVLLLRGGRRRGGAKCRWALRGGVRPPGEGWSADGVCPTLYTIPRTLNP